MDPCRPTPGNELVAVHHDDVEISLHQTGQQPVGLAIVEAHLHVAKASAEPNQSRGHQHLARSRERSQPKPATGPGGDLADGLLQGREGTQRLTGALTQELGRCRRPNPVGGPIKQNQPTFGLQGAHLLRDRRPRVTELSTGTGKRADA